MYCVLLRKHIQLHFIPVLSKFHCNSLDFFFSRALKIRYHMSSFQEMTGPNRALNKMHYWRLVYLFTYILAQMCIHVENQKGEKNQAIKSRPVHSESWNSEMCRESSAFNISEWSTTSPGWFYLRIYYLCSVGLIDGNMPFFKMYIFLQVTTPR